MSASPEAHRGMVVDVLRNAGLRAMRVAVLSSLFFALSHSTNVVVGQLAVTVALKVVSTSGSA